MAGVLVAGGKGFKMGDLGAGWVRITFSVPEGTLIEGLLRVERELFSEGELNGENKLNGVKKVSGVTKRKVCEGVAEKNGSERRKLIKI